MKGGHKTNYEKKLYYIYDYLNVEHGKLRRNKEILYLQLVLLSDKQPVEEMKSNNYLE